MFLTPTLILRNFDLNLQIPTLFSNWKLGENIILLFFFLILSPSSFSVRILETHDSQILRRGSMILASVYLLCSACKKLHPSFAELWPAAATVSFLSLPHLTHSRLPENAPRIHGDTRAMPVLDASSDVLTALLAVS